MPEMQTGLYFRSFKIELAEADDNERALTLTFSSETPHVRYGEKEILLHGDDNVQLDRLNAMGALLLNHRPRFAGDDVNILGRVERAWLENRIAYARVVFDTDEESERYYQKVKGGSLRGVSVGALIHAITEIQAGENIEGYEGPAWLAQKWEPIEVSLTPIPVDASVGLKSLKSLGADTGRKTTQTGESDDMDKNEVQALIDAAVGPLADQLKSLKVPTAEEIAAQIQAQNAPQLRLSTDVFQQVCDRAAAVGIECKSEVVDLALSGKTETELYRYIAEKAGGSKGPDAGDPGAGGGDGNQDPGARARAISDDALLAGLTHPSQF